MSFRPLQTAGASYVPPSDGMVAIAAPKFTCVGCGLAFNSSEAQQAHFRTDFHIYNLRRKVLDYTPVSEEEFVAIQKAEVEKQKVQPGQRKRCVISCDACEKSFSSDTAYQQHCKTKKHKDSVSRTKKPTAHVVPRSEIQPVKRPNAKNPTMPTPEIPIPDKTVIRTKEERAEANSRLLEVEANGKIGTKLNNNSNTTAKETTIMKQEVAEEAEEDIYGESSLTDSDRDKEDSSFGESEVFEGSEETQAWQFIGKAIEEGKVTSADINDMVWDLVLSKRKRFTDDECPFCSFHEGNFEKLLQHMEQNHDFRIPDREYCTNEQAVFFYVQDKIAVGRQCLKCGRIFGKVKNVRDHMNALSHCRFALGRYNKAFEDEGIASYYDYSQMWDVAYEEGKAAQSKLGLIKDKILSLLPGFSKKKEAEKTKDYDERFGLPKSFLKKTKFVPSSRIGMSVLGITKDEETKELTLADGKIIGHRDLKKYYDQFAPGLKALVASEMAAKRRRAAYLQDRSGCTSIVLAPSVSETRMMYMQLNKNRIMAQFRAHKLVEHFVDQNQSYLVPK